MDPIRRFVSKFQPDKKANDGFADDRDREIGRGIIGAMMMQCLATMITGVV